MIERNPLWAPIAPALDPIETTLRTLWAYERTRVRVARTQRYSLVVVEPLPPMVQRAVQR